MTTNYIKSETITKSLSTIYGKEIKIGDNFKDYFQGNYNSGEKIVSEIKETNNGLNYQIIFQDGSIIETSYRNLAKINE